MARSLAFGGRHRCICITVTEEEAEVNCCQLITLTKLVSDQFLNSTSAHLGYTVPFTSVYAGNIRHKTNQEQTQAHYKN